MGFKYKKANLSLKNDLYAWLEGIRKRMDARSVPEVIRMLLKLMRQATADENTARMMIESIEALTTNDPGINEVDLLFSEYQEQQRQEITQGYNINQRT